MKQQYIEKLNEWYGSETIQRYEILKEIESEILLLVAHRERTSRVLMYDIVRIFIVGDVVRISVDVSDNSELTMESVFKLIKTAIRVSQ